MYQNSQQTNSCEYEIRTATAQDRLDIFQLVKKSFFMDEPINEALNNLGRGFCSTISLENFPIAAVEDNLSFAAVTKSGEIIGFVQNVIIKPQNSNPDSETYNCERNSDQHQIFKLLEHIDTKIDKHAKVEDNEKEMVARTVVVDKSWRNMGVGKKLLSQTKERAKQLGFKQIRATCTSAYSAKLFTACGFECVYALKYEDWKNGGNMDFLPKREHSHAKGMVLHL